MQYGSRGNTIDNDPLLYHSVQTREKTIIGGAESGQKAATYCARIQGRPPKPDKWSPRLMRITRRAEDRRHLPSNVRWAESAIAPRASPRHALRQTVRLIVLLN